MPNYHFVLILLCLKIACNSGEDVCNVEDESECVNKCCRQNRCELEQSPTFCCEDPTSEDSDPNCAICPTCGMEKHFSLL